MAGSQRAYDYVSDAGATWGLRQDRTNGDAAGNTPTPTNTVRLGLPKTLKPRTAIYQWVHSGAAGEGTGRSIRRIVYGSKAAFDALALGATLSLPDYQSVPGATPTTPSVMRAFVLIDKIAERSKRTVVGGESGAEQG